MSELRFPILRSHLPADLAEVCPTSIAWADVSACEVRARINHGSGLVRLAARGGLCPMELWCLILDKPLAAIAEGEVNMAGAVLWMRELVA